MVDNKFVLLLGNGINRTIDNDKYSSDNLISRLANSLIDFDATKILKNVSFPLCFESICGLNLDKLTPQKLMLQIREHLNELNSKENELYKLIDIKKCLSIITTNYDLSIEHSLGLGKKTSAIKRNGGYKTVSESFTIFHIHGVIDNETHTQNICLGILGYNKFCRSLQSGIPSSFNNILKKINKYKKIFPVWVQSIFDNDVYIVGLNLGESEQDLWYLLTLRAFLISAGINIKNKIIYYDINPESKAGNLKAFYKGLFIDYKERIIKDKSEYKNEYVFILKDLFRSSSY